MFMEQSRRRKILIIDDDEQWRELLAVNFGLEFQVSAEGDGAKGLAAAARELPDLVLCDMVMPGMSGLEVVRQASADPVLFSVPVLMMTGRQLGAVELELLKRHANVRGYLVKSVSVEEIRRMAAAVLRFPEQFAADGHAEPRAAKRRSKILVADDNATFAQLLALALSPGDVLLAVDDGLDAWERLKAERPDVVIVDMLMPRMSGVEILRAMNTDSGLKRIPALLVTGLALRPEQIAMLHRDFRNLRRVLGKPCQLGELRQAVETCLVRDLTS